MRVRVNFTVEVDVDEYRDKIGPPNATKEDIRRWIQGDAINRVTFGLGDEGVSCTYLGQNNRYDPETRQTIHEEYVNT